MLSVPSPRAPLFVAVLALALPNIVDAGPVTFSASGSNPASIQSEVDDFRTALGTLNPPGAGSVGSGRREINWDGVPDNFAAPNNLPADFFNVNSPRGAVFNTPGTGFQVSANSNNPTSTPVEFGNLASHYPGLFRTFSPQRLFTALGSTIVDVNFFVPGSSTPALVSGFGAVFSDVDLANVTNIEYFGANGASLGQFFVTPGSGNETLSFLGVQFSEGAVVSRVRITSGNQVVGSAPSPDDLVVMDDFIYGEPVLAAIVPEPTSLVAAASGSLVLTAWGFRRRRKS